MADKGKIMSQTYYERQSRLLNLYQESFTRKEMNANEAVIALRMIGFSGTIAANRVRDWEEHINTVLPETDKARKQRLKQQASLEKYVLQVRLGKKYYLRRKYKQNEISKEETVKKLVQKGYKQETAKALVAEWEAEK
ncbi:MAG: hypothetical protein LBH20_06045 [Treponema sp.]|jgi:hypothetical protein|nr:hypothetical protein [Treponema sp.]